MAPLFTLRTLGVPVLLASTGEAVRFRTRKHFALLVRLAVEPDRPLTRDHLIDLLWGSAPERHGRHSLAQAVTVLKAKVGRQHVLIPSVHDRAGVGADPSDSSVRPRVSCS